MDIYAMSNYSTITSLSESPMSLSMSVLTMALFSNPDGGKLIRKIQGLTNAFVNDIKADLHNENIVYAVFDNHKYGDYKPWFSKP